MRYALCCIGLLFTFFVGQIAQAQDKALVDLHAALAPLRTTLGPDGTQLPLDSDRNDFDLRNATPALNGVKHILRDWIEAHLSNLTNRGDDKALTVALNDELRKADLLCDTPTDRSWNRCISNTAAWSHLGFLDAVSVEFTESGKVVLMRTGVGILCGTDASAYVYAWQKDKWQRIWQNEQEIAVGKPYTPQIIDAVHVAWPDEKTKERLILSLGHMSWCSSNLYPVYFRLWRAKEGGEEPKLLLDKTEHAFLANVPPISGSVGKEKGGGKTQQVSIEFSRLSLDPGIGSYQAVRNYRIDGDDVRRVAPVALSPRTFAQEWLTTDWRESSGWVASGRAKVLAPWHKKFHDYTVWGQFLDHTQHCAKAPDLWQVGVGFGVYDKPSTTLYFLVRWRPPYYFEMADVSGTPHTDCSKPDQAADNE